QEMDRAGTGRRHADADLAGELRVAARHERRHLLVPDLDQLRIAGGAVEGAEDRVDPVAGVAVDTPNAPVAQALEQEVGHELGHLVPLWFVRGSAAANVSTQARAKRHPAPSDMGERLRTWCGMSLRDMPGSVSAVAVSDGGLGRFAASRTGATCAPRCRRRTG